MPRWASLLLLSVPSLSIVLTAASDVTPERAPYHPPSSDNHIDDEYIVHFHPGYDLASHEAYTGISVSGQSSFRNMSFIPGYNARLTSHELHELVRNDPNVKLVEHNEHIPYPHGDDDDDDDHEIPGHGTHYESRLNKRVYAEDTVLSIGYNLPMISAEGTVDFSSNPSGYYTYLVQPGLGIRIYVLDSGINTAHELFGGRAINFQDESTSPYTNPPDLPVNDIRGHGTRMAGDAGAKQYGVAPFSTLVNVKIWGDEGTTSAGLAQAISDVASEHSNFKNGQGAPMGFKGSIINLSLAGSFSAATQLALSAANAAGITVVTAAGNYNPDDGGGNAGNAYPCFESAVICVGAVDSTYTKWSGSRYGSVVGIMAPGVDILSLSNTADTGVSRRSGTSDATAFVSGTLAIWGAYESTSDPGTLTERLYANALNGVVQGLKSSQPNRLLNTGINSPARDSQRIPYVGAPNIGTIIGDPATTAPPYSQDTWRPETQTDSPIVETTVAETQTNDDASYFPQLPGSTTLPTLPSPTATNPTCSLAMEIDAWTGDTDNISPYWLKVLKLDTSNGDDLSPNMDWHQCGATYPVLVISKIFNVLQLAPITPNPGSVLSTPYVQITSGDLSFASTDPEADGHGCDPIEAPGVDDQDPECGDLFNLNGCHSIPNPVQTLSELLVPLS